MSADMVSVVAKPKMIYTLAHMCNPVLLQGRKFRNVI